MERLRNNKKITKPKLASAILVSDLHLTDTIPISRIDHYLLAQKKKLLFLQLLSEQNNDCPILCAGDVFDHWKASPWLCSMAYTLLPKPFISIPGQHDLPMHALEYYGKSALSLLDAVFDEDDLCILGVGEAKTAQSIICPNDLFVVGCPFGALEGFDPKEVLRLVTQKWKILLLHELVWKGQSPPWSTNSWTDQNIFEKFGEYFDIILTGDNHGGFTSRKGDCWIVNPGSMLRMNADQAQYKPRCYLYYAEENDVVPAFFPIENDVHNQEHIDRKKGREERIAAYVEQMKGDWEVGISFRKNLEAFFIENETPQKIKEVILWHLETEKI